MAILLTGLGFLGLAIGIVWFALAFFVRFNNKEKGTKGIRQGSILAGMSFVVMVNGSAMNAPDASRLVAQPTAAPANVAAASKPTPVPVAPAVAKAPPPGWAR